MGLLLPFLAAWLYAGEADACITQGEFRVDYCKAVCGTKYEKGPFYFVTDIEHNRMCVRTLDVPKGQVRTGYECWIKQPGAVDFVKFDCKLTAATGWIQNIPVKHGQNEVKIYATTQSGLRSIALQASWYVKARAETPEPQIEIDGKVGVDPNAKVGALENAADGSCNPLIIPIRAENGSTVYYTIGGNTYNTGKLAQPNAPAKPPYMVEYDLQTQGKTSLAPGETVNMTIWAEDSLPLDAKGKKWQTVTSTIENWTVICPAPPAPIVVSVKRPPSGYASIANVEFEAVGGGNPPMFCSLNNAAFVPCTSPELYTGLTAGTQTFRVYATPGAVTTQTWRVYPPDVVWAAALPPPGPATTVTFWFRAADGVDVPVTFACRLNGGLFEPCTSPHTINSGLIVGADNFFEVQATSSVGTGEISGHTWKVELQGGGGGGGGGVRASPTSAGDLKGGCTAAAGMPLSLLALAGLWAARRRRT